MKRPNIKEWVIQEGEDTEEMPVGAFLPNAFREAQEKYIDYLETKVKKLGLFYVRNSNLPLWSRPLLIILTMAVSTLYIIYNIFYCY